MMLDVCNNTIYNMGLQCFRTTPYKCYSTYLNIQNPTLLKEQWSSIKLFKLKKIFESNSTFNEGTRERTLSFESFIRLLPQLAEERYSAYSDHHKQRLFDLFDREGDGHLSWSTFLAGYTLCEYGSEEVLAVIMFALFDADLRQRLSRLQLGELLSLNAKYLREDGSLEIDEETALDGLLGEANLLGIDEWLEGCPVYIDFSKFRRIFNVWAEEEVERELAQRFGELNELFDQSRSKYVGYLVNYKWFQSWKTHVNKEYGLQVNGFSNNLTYNRTMKTLRTQKSLRTKKTLRSIKTIRTSKSIHSIKSLKKTLDCPRLREIPYQPTDQQQSSQFNLVYANIGDKPAYIYNNLLQGEFSEILIPQLIENIHYIIVSEEVWRRLKLIYGAYPQFRRTGEKAMEIYPKNFKIYTKFHHGKIDFDEEQVCEFSNALQLNSLLAKVMQMPIQHLSLLSVYFKTCSMFKWEPIPSLNIRTSELSSQQIVFLAVVEEEEAKEFQEINCVAAESVQDIHVGDEFLYIDPLQHVQRRAVFMGRARGRMVVHFRGASYIYDLCINRQDFLQRSFLSRRSAENTRNKVRVQELQLVGLPNSKGLGFINSVLLSLFSCEDMARLLATFHREQPKDLLQHLACISHMLSNAYQARAVVVADMVRRYFYEFSNFEFTMCEPEFFEQLHVHFERHNFINFQNPASDYLIELQHKIQCSHCGRGTTQQSSIFSLTLPIPTEEAKYYELIYVPFAYSLKAVQLKKYAFSLPKNAMFKDYREAFQKTAQLKNPHYLLAEVHGNNVIKNYLNAKDDALLKDLLLREDDLIFAYELCFRIDTFVADHYNNDPPKLKNLKVGQMVDFQKEKTLKRSSKKKVKVEGKDGKDGKDGKGWWSFGKISQIDIEPYTHKWVIEVEYRQNRVEVVSCSVNPEKTSIAAFPTRSFLYADHYHLRLLNRLYNEVTNQMQLCNIPLVMMVAGWMRLRQVELLVYQQVRHLIAASYKFKLAEEGYQQQQGQNKVSKKDKMKRFKEYLYNSTKPYRLVFTDHEGRCSLCCKIQKSVVDPSQVEFTCEGCQLDPDTPIFWQLRPYQVRLCVDWLSLDSFVKPYIGEHSSYAATKAARKNSVESVGQCLRQRVRVLTDGEECCCSYSGPKRMVCEERVINVPERLVVMFDRMVQEEQNYKRINRKYIHFQMEEMDFNGQSYQLVAATSIEGSQVDARYLTYLRRENHWLEYNGQHVKIVKKTVVQKICALLLQYKRLIKNDRRMANIRQ